MSMRAWLAFAVVCVVWGSTYLAIRVMVEDVPPLFGAGTRFLVAGAVAALFVAVRHGPAGLRVTAAELRGCVVIGLLLPAAGNGLVTVAEQRVQSANAALIIASVPIWVAAFRAGRGERLSRTNLVGTVIGFAGLVVLLQADWAGLFRVGPGLVAFASVCWAFGSFIQGSLTLPENVVVTTAYEMLSGGLIMVAVAAVRGEDFGLSGLPAEAWSSWLYLVVFGSLLSFSCYAWLLQNAPLSIVSTYAYINPLVAVVLGTVFLEESLSAGALLGGAVTLLGVVLVVGGERRRPAVLVPPPPEVPAGDEGLHDGASRP